MCAERKKNKRAEFYGTNKIWFMLGGWVDVGIHYGLKYEIRTCIWMMAGKAWLNLFEFDRCWQYEDKQIFCHSTVYPGLPPPPSLSAHARAHQNRNHPDNIIHNQPNQIISMNISMGLLTQWLLIEYIIKRRHRKERNHSIDFPASFKIDWK